LELGIVVFDVTVRPRVLPFVVDQPRNVRPDAVGLGGVPILTPALTLRVEGLTEPPLAFHVMVRDDVLLWVIVILRVVALYALTAMVAVRVLLDVLFVVLIINEPFRLPLLRETVNQPVFLPSILTVQPTFDVTPIVLESAIPRASQSRVLFNLSRFPIL